MNRYRVNPLHALRLAKGDTLKQAEVALGLDVSTIRLFEKGKVRPHPRNWPKYARYYGVTMAELIGIFNQLGAE